MGDRIMQAMPAEERWRPSTIVGRLRGRPRRGNVVEADLPSPGTAGFSSLERCWWRRDRRYFGCYLPFSPWTKGRSQK